MDEAEFWLLDVVVTGRVPLEWLLWEDLDEALNRPGHGLDPDALLDMMDRLFRGGFINARRPQRSGDHGELGRFLHRSEIEATLHGFESGMSYGMTARGGARWEAVTSRTGAASLTSRPALIPMRSRCWASIAIVWLPTFGSTLCGLWCPAANDGKSWSRGRPRTGRPFHADTA
jgi:hypothetical protein